MSGHPNSALQRLRDNLASAPQEAEKCFVSLDDHRAILAAYEPMLEALEHIVGAAHEAPRFGPFDQIDNTGQPYQSQDFSDALEKGRKAIALARGAA